MRSSTAQGLKGSSRRGRQRGPVRRAGTAHPGGVGGGHRADRAAAKTSAGQRRAAGDGQVEGDAGPWECERAVAQVA